MENQKERKILTHVTQSYKIFLFFLLLFGSYGNANEYLPIINVTEKWSASHNDKSINSLQLLYANKLNYYSSDFSRKKVLTDKKTFFNKYSYFSHNIENIEVSYIGMEQYLVKFDKYVKLNLSDSDKVYPSYLVVKKFGEKYKIIVEGDQITDSNLDGEVRSQGLYKVRSNVLNVRKEPHKYSVILNTMKKNELIHIDVFIGKWGKSNNGWLSSKYLQLAETIDSDIGKNHAKKDTMLLSEEYSNMKVPAVYEVRIGKLNVRDAPGKSSKVLAIVKLGDRVNIYEFDGKWGRSDRGWISGKHLKKIYNAKDDIAQINEVSKTELEESSTAENKNLSWFQKAVDTILGIISTLFFMFIGLFVLIFIFGGPISDGRFKTGYKGNEVSRSIGEISITTLYTMAVLIVIFLLWKIIEFI